MIWLLPWGQENHVRRTPWAVYALITLNVSVYAWTVTSLPDDPTAFLDTYGLMTDDWRWYQFITSAFLHADLWHLLGNMLFLWLFGESVEDALGWVPFLLLYAVGGLLGDMLYVHNNTGFLHPSIGASGCVSAVAGAYGVLFHDRRVNIRLMFLVFTLTTFTLRGLWMVLLWFGMDLFRTLHGAGTMSEDDSVNFVAHGVGFLCGAALGLFARLHGVMYRYDRVQEGHGWLGYWPQGLGRRHRRPTPRHGRR